MPDNLLGDSVPIGFGMHLMQNSRAMRVFSSLPEAKQRAIISGARTIDSYEAMQAYVSKIVNEPHS